MTTPAFLQQAIQATQAANPANGPEKAPRQRIPLGLPTLKLGVPEIPGYVCYWFRGTPHRLTQAQQAGYTFVERGEVELNHHGLANDYESDGNSDMGSRVSVSSGDANPESGSRLYLMKLPLELWRQDEDEIEAKHEEIAQQLRGDRGLDLAGQDRSKNYSRGESRNLFTPKRRP